MRTRTHARTHTPLLPNKWCGKSIPLARCPVHVFTQELPERPIKHPRVLYYSHTKAPQMCVRAATRLPTPTKPLGGMFAPS